MNRITFVPAFQQRPCRLQQNVPNHADTKAWRGFLHL